MTNKDIPQQKEQINNTDDTINISSVIQKHHIHLSTIFSALKPAFSEVNILNCHESNDGDNGILKKLELLYQEVKENDKKLQDKNWQQCQSLTDITTDLKASCLAVYKELHLLFIKAKDDEEKKDLIESAFFVGELLDYYNGLTTLHQAYLEPAPVTHHEVNLNELVEKVITKVRPVAYHKELNIDFKLASDLPDLIISDEYRLKSILEHLIKNAVKFSKNGSIFLTVNFFKSKKEENNQDFILQLIFRNTNLIISKEKLQALNATFTPLSYFPKNCYKTLNLILVKLFIYEMSGELEVISDKKGISFFCNIPIKLPSIENNCHDDSDEQGII